MSLHTIKDPVAEMNEQITQILLVEDEKDHAELVCRAFEAHRDKFRVTLAGSLAEAEECLAESLPNLIITDLRLPDGLGTSLLAELEKKGGVVRIVLNQQYMSGFTLH